MTGFLLSKIFLNSILNIQSKTDIKIVLKTYYQI